MSLKLSRYFVTAPKEILIRERRKNNTIPLSALKKQDESWLTTKNSNDKKIKRSDGTTREEEETTHQRRLTAGRTEKKSLSLPEIFQINSKIKTELNQILRTLAAAGPLGPSVISN